MAKKPRVVWRRSASIRRSGPSSRSVFRALENFRFPGLAREAYEVGAQLAAVEGVHRDQVRVPDPRHDLAFALEASDAFCVGEVREGQL